MQGTIEMAKSTRKPTEAQKAAIDARDASIREETLELFAALKELTPPAGHEWQLRRGWDSWFCNDLKASCQSGISFMLRATETEWNDPDQLHGEIRVHRGVLQDSNFRPEGAITWFERGSRLAGSPRIDHVVDGSIYVGCDRPSYGLGPVGNRHTYACDWPTMRATLLESVARMLAADAACVEAGRRIPEGHDRERLVA
jgi:hypothetical protein